MCMCVLQVDHIMAKIVVGELKLALNMIVLSMYVISKLKYMSGFRGGRVMIFIATQMALNVCDNDKNISITYLVDGKHCVADQELFGGN